MLGSDSGATVVMDGIAASGFADAEDGAGRVLRHLMASIDLMRCRRDNGRALVDQ